MKVLFTRNIGTFDAARFGMSFDQCRSGDTADVGQVVADELLSRGLATEVVAAKPSELKAAEKVAAEKSAPKPAKPADSTK